MFSKRAGILVSKLDAETHGPAAGGEIKAPRPFDKAAGAVAVLFCKAVGAVGLYHVTPAPVPVFRRHNKLS